MTETTNQEPTHYYWAISPAYSTPRRFDALSDAEAFGEVVDERQIDPELRASY